MAYAFAYHDGAAELAAVAAAAHTDDNFGTLVVVVAVAVAAAVAAVDAAADVAAAAAVSGSAESRIAAVWIAANAAIGAVAQAVAVDAVVGVTAIPPAPNPAWKFHAIDVSDHRLDSPLGHADVAARPVAPRDELGRHPVSASEPLEQQGASKSRPPEVTSSAPELFACGGGMREHLRNPPNTMLPEGSNG
mmetsp:Transcript_36114/g.71891  ORF Transcript_36114/g.71891 Transcript_36114/m.71891 type:complete len:191 (+) Transcript_36114:416-988(+)